MKMASKTFDPKALLERHGWKFGSGLGKDEGGIKEAIKVELKMDRAGMGYDASEKYSFQWWDHVFNTAANSIEVVSDENGVSIKKTSTVDVSTKKLSKRKQTKPKTYGCFVKTATLTNNGIELKDSDSDSSSESDAGVISKMTDEELFKACGGMTGHKGARHGLNLRGKLLRIQQHDEQFLRSQKTLNGSTSNGSSAANVLENTKTKTEASQGNSIQVDKLPLPSDGQDNMNVVSSSDQESSVRKQKKKQKRDSEESKDETKENTDDVDFKPSTNKMITKGQNKKKRRRDDLDTGVVEINNTDEEMTGLKLRKKKRNRECDDNLFVPNGVSTNKEIVSFDEPETEQKKLKKRTKHEESGLGNNESLVDNEHPVNQSEQMTGNSEKKSKKLKKKREQENDEKEQQKSRVKEPLSNETQTEADTRKKQSKKKEKKNRDKEAMTNHTDQPVEDDSVQKKKCKKSKKSGNRKEASMNEIMDHTRERNTEESELQNEKSKKSKIKEHDKKDKIINQIEELAAHESESQRMKRKNAKKNADEIGALPAPESTDHKKVSKTASKKSKKRKREDEEINFKEYGNFHTVCDLEAHISSNEGLDNHILQPKVKRQKKNSCMDCVGKTNDCEINNTSH